MPRSFPTLTSERLLLRRFNDNDLENVFKGLSHPEVIKYYGVSYDSLEGTKEQMRWFADLEKNGTGLWWAVCAKSDGRFLGGGGLNDLSRIHNKAEIGYWLLPDYWGKGYMKEGMQLILKYAFGPMQLHRIEGFVDSQNAACKRGITKLDFIREGTMRECEVKDGRRVSVDIYSRLVTDA